MHAWGSNENGMRLGVEMIKRWELVGSGHKHATISCLITGVPVELASHSLCSCMLTGASPLGLLVS